MSKNPVSAFDDTTDFTAVERRLGVSRRTFLKFCTGVAASFGLGPSAALAMAKAVANPQRPPVIWLHGQECTGPSESLLRSEQPSFEHLILDLISLDYHQTLDAGAGHFVEEIKRETMQKHQGEYLLVIEGAIPLAQNGIFCKIGGQTMMDATREAAEHAAAIVAFGSCASWGGVQSAAPNPTGAVGAPQFLKGKTVVTIPGCPPNPANFLGTVLYFVTYGKLPPIDDKGRPKWAYSRLIHENCYRRPHFDAGRFATQFGDEGHRKGYCLYKLGCKGPETYNNCPSLEYNNLGGGVWPIGVGHPCFGCSEQGTGFHKPMFSLSEVKAHTPPLDPLSQRRSSVAKRITVDPITRIKGHLRIDVEVDNGRVTKAWSSGQMWRGIEKILVGRDPREAWSYTQRFCGVCTTVHAITSVRRNWDNPRPSPSAREVRPCTKCPLPRAFCS